MQKYDAALSEIGVLKGLSDGDLAQISRQCAWRRVNINEQIIGHLDKTSDVYFVVQGTMRVINYSLEGKVISFRDMHPGEMFGEISAIDGQARSASVYALSDGFIGSLTAEKFWQILVDYPSVACSVFRTLVEHIRRLTERVFEFSVLTVNERIHAELLRLAIIAGIEDNASTISPSPTHAEIANHISTNRESVTREINALAKQGVLGKAKRTLTIRDVRWLQDAVNTKLGEYAPRTDH